MKKKIQYDLDDFDLENLNIFPLFLLVNIIIAIQYSAIYEIIFISLFYYSTVRMRIWTLPSFNHLNVCETSLWLERIVNSTSSDPAHPVMATQASGSLARWPE